LEPVDFHYMDNNSSNILQKIKKVMQVELVPAPHSNVSYFCQY